LEKVCCRRSSSSCSTEAFGMAGGLLEDNIWLWSLSNYERFSFYGAARIFSRWPTQPAVHASKFARLSVCYC